MNRYVINRVVGDGSFGTVYAATCKRSGEPVAIKFIKHPLASWSEALGLREVASLTKLRHPSIIRLREVIYQKEDGGLYFVFDFASSNLYNVMQARKAVAGAAAASHAPVLAGGFTEAEVAHITGSLLRALAYMHRHGFFHRDIKPENLLCDVAETEGGAADIFNGNFRLCDFGQARETRSRPPYTDYVGTRWYRAPECVLGMKQYNSPIDIWAAGAVMAELCMGKPIFPGTSAMNQFYTIVNVLGPPSTTTWPEGFRAAQAMGLKISNTSATTRLDELMPDLSEAALDALHAMLQWDPAKRPSAADVLNMPFFRAFVALADDADKTSAAGAHPRDAAVGIRSASPDSGWTENDFESGPSPAVMSSSEAHDAGGRRTPLMMAASSDRRVSGSSSASMPSSSAAAGPAAAERPAALGVAFRHARGSSTSTRDISGADAAPGVGLAPLPLGRPGLGVDGPNSSRSRNDDTAISARRTPLASDRPREPPASLADSIDRDLHDLGLDGSLELSNSSSHSPDKRRATIAFVPASAPGTGASSAASRANSHAVGPGGDAASNRGAALGSDHADGKWDWDASPQRSDALAGGSRTQAAPSAALSPLNESKLADEPAAAAAAGSSAAGSTAGSPRQGKGVERLRSYSSCSPTAGSGTGFFSSLLSGLRGKSVTTKNAMSPGRGDASAPASSPSAATGPTPPDAGQASMTAQRAPPPSAVVSQPAPAFREVQQGSSSDQSRAAGAANPASRRQSATSMPPSASPGLAAKRASVAEAAQGRKVSDADVDALLAELEM